MHSTWKTSLSLLLNQQLSESAWQPTLRVAILGVGNLFRSDDAAGILVARALLKTQSAGDTEHIRIIEAGQTPENATWELRKFAPDLVLFVDAAEMGKSPGTIQWISEDVIDSLSASTHSLPLSMLAHYLRLELSCKTAMLGIQPHSKEVGEIVSEEVLRAVNEAVGELDEVLRMFFPKLPKAKTADRSEAKLPLGQRPDKNEWPVPHPGQDLR